MQAHQIIKIYCDQNGLREGTLVGPFGLFTETVFFLTSEADTGIP